VGAAEQVDEVEIGGVGERFAAERPRPEDEQLGPRHAAVAAGEFGDAASARTLIAASATRE
jgi:hypothetical protein